MDIKNLTLKEAREKLGVKQDELGKVFTEAKSDGGYDFSKVKCLGDDVKGSIAVAEKVKAMNSELDELASHAEQLEAAEKAAGDHADREKARRRFPLPGQSDGKGADSFNSKSLGERVAEEKGFQDWAQRGAAGGITFGYDDMYPSDMLAKGASYATMGSKALMARDAGFAPESIRQSGFVEAAVRPVQLLDILPMFQIGQTSHKYMEEVTRVHGAEATAEGELYGESAFTFVERTSAVQKITDSVPVTDEQLEDVKLMEGYINSRLTFGLRQKLDTLALVGDGLDPNLRGLKNVAGIQTQVRGADPVMDAFFKAMTKIRLIGRAIPTHHIMHPLDWQDIRLTRTVDGIYIFGSPTEAGPERLWGLPVVQQDADVAGRGYVGSFQPAWVALFERKGVDIQIGYVNAQFAQGRRTVRGDCRFALSWMRPAAFCEVTGLDAA